MSEQKVGNGGMGPVLNGTSSQHTHKDQLGVLLIALVLPRRSRNLSRA